MQTAIWHDGVFENSLREVSVSGIPEISCGQISSTQITTSEQENAQIQFRQIGMAENQALGIHPNVSQVGTSEVSPAQISSTQTPFLNSWAHDTIAGLIEPSFSALIPLVLIEDQVDLSKIPFASSIIHFANAPPPVVRDGEK